MQTIHLETRIAAPAMRVFLLSLSVDLHKASTAASQEEAVAGKTSGVMHWGDEVTWRARHFGFWLHHAVKITKCGPPTYFRDEMTRGLFKSFIHDHWFEEADGVTTMRDRLTFSAPLGPLGLIAERLALRSHLHELLKTRNTCIKRAAEGTAWKQFLADDAL